MKKAGMVAGLVLAVMLTAACDDIGSPIQNHFAPPPAPEQKKAAAVTPLTREEMEADCRFIFSIRASIREMAETALQARENGQISQFGDMRATFNFQYNNWTAMVDRRKGMIDSTGEVYPAGHPAAILKQALSLLRLEMDQYYRKMNDMVVTTPDADAQLLETMKQARAALDQFTPAEGEAPIPVK